MGLTAVVGLSGWRVIVAEEFWAARENVEAIEATNARVWANVFLSMYLDSETVDGPV